MVDTGLASMDIAQGNVSQLNDVKMSGSDADDNSSKLIVESSHGKESSQGKEGGIISSLCGASEEGFDEELSVLPRHTKVVVTGNNRTKSVLVGLHGVVKKAVGLGGWHWLVLTNGLEVKLQRNALSVLEPPTGLEEDEDSDEGKSNVEDYPKPYRMKARPPRTNIMGKGGGSQKWQVADASSTASKSSQRLLWIRKLSSSDETVLMFFKKVNLSKLETAALLRYRRRFELAGTGPNSSKEQLLDAVERHFSAQKLDEFQVIARFMQAAKRLKTVYG